MRGYVQSRSDLPLPGGVTIAQSALAGFIGFDFADLTHMGIAAVRFTAGKQRRATKCGTTSGIPA